MGQWNVLVHQPSISILESESQWLFVGIYKGHLRIYSFSAEQSAVQMGKGEEQCFDHWINKLKAEQWTRSPCATPSCYAALLEKKKISFRKQEVWCEGMKEKNISAFQPFIFQDITLKQQYKNYDALCTTVYNWGLCSSHCIVAVSVPIHKVFGVGGWQWRQISPPGLLQPLTHRERNVTKRQSGVPRSWTPPTASNSIKSDLQVRCKYPPAQ